MLRIKFVRKASDGGVVQEKIFIAHDDINLWDMVDLLARETRWLDGTVGFLDAQNGVRVENLNGDSATLVADGPATDEEIVSFEHV